MEDKVKKRFHIFGASGSGTTTLGKAIAEKLNIPQFDTDDFYWVKTDPPFQKKQLPALRQHQLQEDLDKHESWVLTGSLCGWGDFAIPLFDLVVFLWIPSDIRMQRLKDREIERYGVDIFNSDHPGHKQHRDFLTWAEAYDSGGLNMRSRAMHEKWISSLPQSVLRIEGNKTVSEYLDIVLKQICS
mgnify:CR=1 FL=1